MSKQKFKFAELYRNNKAAVEKVLSSMWCGETQNDSQKAYVNQLKGIIPYVFAPSDALPLVQCMNSYKTIFPEHEAEFEEMLADLWLKSISGDKYYSPYEHQFQCWKTLLKDRTADGKMMSTVVITGTGSGKTECFMLPLVKDLIENHKENLVQAIFLYPLNALMEDQKSRMERLLAGTNLTFAVYNGDLPEDVPNENDRYYRRDLHKYDSIKGITRDEHGNVIEMKYKHIIATRRELRQTPANILLTNPTMLEYILLRDKDANLIQKEMKSLRWIALDETHTYTGAGAAEMAMLLRRVLMAYGVTTDDVRFATSSATLGKKGDGDYLELREFIAGITGLQLNQIRCVDGERNGIDNIPPDEDEIYWKRLINDNHDGYIRLDELFDDNDSIEGKLEHLDKMCQMVEDLGIEDLRVKVHYFYKVPNQGLYVDISDPYCLTDGSFKIYSNNELREASETVAPLLELSRCKHCGEYVAIAEDLPQAMGLAYQPISSDDSDMFDLDDTEKTGKNYYVFGMTQGDDSAADGNVPYIIHGNQMQNVTALNKPASKWHVIANVQCNCPYCGTKLTKQSSLDDGNPDATQSDEQDSKKLVKFRVSSDFISRQIAPSTLDLMTEAEVEDGAVAPLHKGQQYISFVDSRQMAARSTIKQNLEEERLWIYGTIYHELCKRALGSMSKDEAVVYYENIYNDRSLPFEKLSEANDCLKILKGNDQAAIETLLSSLKAPSYLSWKDIFDLLLKDPLADRFCQQFAERSELSKELDDNFNITDEIKRRYILAIMVEYLSKRPLLTASPETMGLFTSHYAKLDKVLVDALPDAVNEFNNILADNLKISQKDWHDLMQIFLDFTVRSNESVYLNMDNYDSMDIFKSVRFATRKERRRSVHKPEIKEKSPNSSRVIRLLAKLIADSKHLTITDVVRGYAENINKVIDCLWNSLTDVNADSLRLLNPSTHYDEEQKCHVLDKGEIIDDIYITPYRLNLADLGFKLYEDVYLCDTNVHKDMNHVKCLRPIEATFHGYSPYMVGGDPLLVNSDLHERWEAYPFYKTAENNRCEVEIVEEWAKEARKLLWNNDLWGEYGTFATRLLQIHQFPDLFVQAEHTAQVDKMISRQVQEDFKSHQLNILACSTTMEMGVDLGDLELVMMLSVPPHPSNYKQRAGRSGRRGQVRSACVTLCGSDAVGIRTLQNPMNNVILREVSTPTVDLNSPQVIQRHVNSFLIRGFGIFEQVGGSVTEKVLDYYTNYTVVPEGESNHQKIKRKGDSHIVDPTDGLGDELGTPYAKFNQCCMESLTDELRSDLKSLLRRTVFEDRVDYVVTKAKEANERCYAELELHIQDYAEPYRSAEGKPKQQTFYEMKFIEPLSSLLLSYWATHRFIPNANMPVNVIEFDINSSTQTYYSKSRVSNPSYPLRTALSQYAPGNPIARDGIVRTVRGIRYSNFFKPLVTFKTLYYNREQVVIDVKDEIEHPEKWTVNSQIGLELLQPTEFIPDMNESSNRVLDQNEYTRVSAQLIGTDEWNQDRTEPHLFDARSSREGGNGQILYYNEGVGYGYCHCTKCGRTVLERWSAASSSDPNKLPGEMNPILSKDSDKENYHFSLVKNGSRPRTCLGCSKPEYIKRNVVLGDTIQTDYCEIRIRHLNKDWIKARHDNENLLTTLGLVFTQALSEELNIERNDLDFTVTPNGHICVFDTNPGGSGYANQLVAMDLLKAVVDRSYDIIIAAEQANSKDCLIDKFTLHYLNMVDIPAAKDWLEEEREARKILPNNIAQIFPDATETSLVKLQKAFATSQRVSTLFVDNDFAIWDYDDSEHSWKTRFFPYFANRGQSPAFCVTENTNSYMSQPIVNMLRSIDGWTGRIVHAQNSYVNNGIFPLAYIDGRLYFTNNPDHITMNDCWGNGTIFTARCDNFAENADKVDLSYKPNQKVFKIEKNESTSIKTNELGEIIYEKAKDVIDQFIAYVKTSNAPLELTYQDEHLKSVLGMVLTLQTIEYFVKLMNQRFDLEFKLEEYREDWSYRFPLYENFISKQLKNDEDRDLLLDELAKQWVKRLNGNVHEIESLPEKELTHWREFSIKCGNKKLVIYPDGGFANGWAMPKQPDGHWVESFKIGTTNATRVIKIVHNMAIKYDVVMEDL